MPRNQTCWHNALCGGFICQISIAFSGICLQGEFEEVQPSFTPFCEGVGLLLHSKAADWLTKEGQWLLKCFAVFLNVYTSIQRVDLMEYQRGAYQLVGYLLSHLENA